MYICTICNIYFNLLLKISFIYDLFFISIYRLPQFTLNARIIFFMMVSGTSYNTIIFMFFFLFLLSLENLCMYVCVLQVDFYKPFLATSCLLWKIMPWVLGWSVFWLLFCLNLNFIERDNSRHNYNTSESARMVLLISCLHNSIYTRYHKISLIRILTLKYLLKGCLFALLAGLCLYCLCVLFHFHIFLNELWI